jgi:hypothetical protein
VGVVRQSAETRKRKPKMPRLITCYDAAEIIGCGVRHVETLIDAGVLKSYTRHGRLTWCRPSLESVRKYALRSIEARIREVMKRRIYRGTGGRGSLTICGFGGPGTPEEARLWAELRRKAGLHISEELRRKAGL